MAFFILITGVSIIMITIMFITQFNLYKRRINVSKNNIGIATIKKIVKNQTQSSTSNNSGRYICDINFNDKILENVEMQYVTNKKIGDTLNVYLTEDGKAEQVKTPEEAKSEFIKNMALIIFVGICFSLFSILISYLENF